IRSTLTRLGDKNLLPDIIQIGNETNRGILLSQAVNDQGWTLDWNRNVYLFQAALSAIDETALLYGVDIRTAIHIADPEDVPWFVEQFIMHGFTGFDIIGISYYWQWHQPVNIPQLGQVITNLKNEYPEKDVMIFETGYGWTTQNADGANNILFNTHPSYAPLSPAHQKKWMTDLTQTVIDHGGSGVVYWEPAWVSTGCETQWVTGSSWDNATFFDFDNKVIPEGGIGWMQHPYDFTSSAEGEEEQSAFLDIFYADGEVIITFNEEIDFKSPCTIAIYSVDGRRMFSKNIISLDDRPIRIPVDGLATGCYIVTIRDKAFVTATELICIPNQ
ncbi:MAG TPA: glycosyl hydrolase 53 family protein, partial [Saprospiraceae bacterium]